MSRFWFFSRFCQKEGRKEGGRRKNLDPLREASSLHLKNAIGIKYQNTHRGTI